MKVIYPDIDLMVVLQQAVKALGIHDGPWPPVCSNGPGHARYRRLVVTDRANARQMARQYAQVLGESLPWAEVRGIAAFWDDCQEPDEGLQQFHLILTVRIIERTQQVTADIARGFFFMTNQKLSRAGTEWLPS